MSHLCRELFPTLLEVRGYLSDLLLEKFEPNKSLYEDILINGMKEPLKNFIYSFSDQIDQNILIIERKDKRIYLRRYYG